MVRSGKKSPVAFISYSWDSPVHQAWVRCLAERLVEKGVEVIFDQWDLEPGQSVTKFMETSIQKAEFVLVICTPNYARRSNAREGGVGYEQQIISGHMAQNLKHKRFIPILRRGSLKPGRDHAIPTHLIGIYTVDFRNEEIGEELERLTRSMFGVPHYQAPQLGEAPMFAKPKRKNKNKSTTVRLPHPELDGYSLRSGVASAELYPETFHIPAANRRARVGKADFVKLLFDYAEEDMIGERMWVRITGSKGPYLVGKLHNQPLEQDEDGWPLTWGDRVHFLPEHIVDIEP